MKNWLKKRRYSLKIIQVYALTTAYAEDEVNQFHDELETVKLHTYWNKMGHKQGPSILEYIDLGQKLTLL